MLSGRRQILDFIPQRPPMVMVDKLIACNPQKAISSFEIVEDNIFNKAGYLSESGLIENIAQTSALMTAWLSYKQDGSEQKAPVGVIGAVKDFQLHFLPEVHSQITTEIEVLFRVGNATIVNGKVKVNKQLAAECELKIFISERL